MPALPGSRSICAFFASLITVLFAAPVHAETIPVRYSQGSAHGFLALRTVEGTRIATGDVTQIIHGYRVTSRVVFHFRDGSLDDETTVFSQRGTFRLISDHHIQRGPTFPKPIDVFIDAVTGKIISHAEDGTVREDHLDFCRMCRMVCRPTFY